ncbi:nucleoside-diphosphate-sugar epimerase [Nitzschia inconspicua]|uniref:Nucleoside-diphosphate-sugar epimerase n=1 Tax=Nitzschia inconspicua TaxID=303405 RepID=A0A9K3K8M1_9STRA|nr:nucleoside-diphosphate-sugar epimerase [Nitzschia inconspicua]KAG7357436.1 nucleoside-diphosphate-sugar epimerase [Nitzschia inconspicua]
MTNERRCCQYIGVLFLLLISATVSFALTTNQESRSGNKVSIVTGANGYIGREVVNVLWNREIKDGSISTILCLVRPARVEQEKQFWNRYLQNQPNGCRLEVLPYDMLDGGESILKALRFASTLKSLDSDGDKNIDICVYHIASVFGPSEDHVQTATDNVQGTKDLFLAMAKIPNCRVVLTSSMAAVRGTGQEPLNGKFYTNQDWNSLSKLHETNWGSSYQWSKAESERIAWDLAKEFNISMTSICPSFVFGPPTGTLSEKCDRIPLSSSYSIELVGQWVRGESPVQSRLCVDVRDVAKAHVAAGSLPNAIGERFIVSTEARVSSEKMAEALAKVCRETKLGDPDAISFDGKFQGGAIPIGAQEVEASNRLQDILGVTLRPVEETIADMGRALLVAKDTAVEK